MLINILHGWGKFNCSQPTFTLIMTNSYELLCQVVERVAGREISWPGRQIVLITALTDFYVASLALAGF